MEKLYSARDIQRLFGFKVGRIRYWDKIGFLTPSVKIGARKYYTSQDLIGLRTAKGLLDAGLPFAKVKRSVIDIKKISSGVKKPLSEILIHEDTNRIPRSGALRLNQSLIGFSQGDLEKGIKSANMYLEEDFKAELDESGTVGKNHPSKRRSIKPKSP